MACAGSVITARSQRWRKKEPDTRYGNQKQQQKIRRKVRKNDREEEHQKSGREARWPQVW